ncbi:MAG: PEGA domain-containing protein [Pseudomonadota bacterium]
MGEGSASRLLIGRGGEEAAYALPVTLGGAAPGAVTIGGSQGPVADLSEVDGGQFLLRPTAGSAVLLNGRPVDARGAALRAGDQLQLSEETYLVGCPVSGVCSLTLASDEPSAGTLPPEESEVTALAASQAIASSTAPGAAPSARTLQPDNTRSASTGAIAPAEFSRSAPVIERSRGVPWQVPAGLVGAVFLAGLWFVFTARSVTIDITPAPERVAVAGGLWKISLADRRLMRSGEYRVTAQREGYHPLEEAFTVGAAPAQTFTYEMAKLPGRITIETDPAQGVSLSVDGDARGATPLQVLSVEPGERVFSATAPRYQPAEVTLDIEGLDREQTVRLSLDPDWADVAVSSSPPGAEIRVDDEVLGTTPATVEVLSGTRQLELKLPGHKRHRQFLQVRAGEPQTLTEVSLAAADGLVNLRSMPSGALVTVDGRFAGQTPVELELQPDRSHRVQLSKAGYQPLTQRVSVPSGEERSLQLSLQAITGTVVIEVEPADAELFVNGRSVGTGAQRVSLPAVEQVIEARRAGYAAATARVTPQAGFEQQVSLALLTEDDAAYAAIPKQPVVGPGVALQFIDPETTPSQRDGALRFTMGSSRRDPDRLANEVQYEVELTRPFYVSTREISNAQFGAFRRGHRSGALAQNGLGDPQQPVVQVSWQDAAAFCNWLSRQEGLSPAYVDQGGQLVAASPMTTGYRLPTEAEWAWLARFAGGDALKFPWGDRLPPAENSGNYAGAEARSIVGAQLRTYEDAYVVSAPVGSFPPGRLGFYDLGGNVAEWVHDWFGINVEPGPLRDPLGPNLGRQRVVRGASFLTSGATELRLTYRDFDDQAREDLGFRVARYYR